MKNLMKFSLLLGMIAVLFLSACKKDEPAATPTATPTDNFGVLKQYLIDNSMDIPDVLDAWITSAAAIEPDLDTYYVIDIRSAEDFAAGHIPGAVNSTLSDVLNCCRKQRRQTNYCCLLFWSNCRPCSAGIKIKRLQQCQSSKMGYVLMESSNCR
jgi:hypothetical protein